MASGKQVAQGVAVVLLIVVLNVILFGRLSNTERRESPVKLTQPSQRSRSALAVWGEQYAAACDMSPHARQSEMALLIPELIPGDTVIIAPGGGGVEAEAIYSHFGKAAALTFKLVLVDTRPQFVMAASNREDQQLRLFLNGNSRLRRMNVASLVDVPMPSASAHAVLVGHDAHHLGRVERTRFLAQMFEILVDEGQLLMLDFSPSESTAAVMAFLEKFVGPKSVFGFRGEFLLQSEMEYILESIGFGSVSVNDVEYDWTFGSEEEMAEYVCSMFGITLIDLERDLDFSQLLEAVAPFRRDTGSSSDVRLTWSATRYIATKSARIQLDASMFPVVESDSEEMYDDEDVDHVVKDLKDYYYNDDQSTVPWDDLSGSVLDDSYSDLQYDDYAPVVPPEELIRNDWGGRVQLVKNLALPPAQSTVSSDEYQFKEQPTVTLPMGSFASCTGFQPMIEGKLTYIVRYHFMQNGWQDESENLLELLRARDNARLPHSLRTKCMKLHAKHPDECMVKAIVSGGDIFHDLTIIHCVKEPICSTIIRAFNKYKQPLPERLRFFETVLPWEAGDKAGLFINFAQRADAETQQMAMRYLPRSFLVAVPCAGRVDDDQWDLWLRDYFDGDEDQMALYAKDWPTRLFIGKSSAWTSPQPSLDKGKNLWISKPCMGLDYDPTKPKKAHVPMHQGFDIDIIYSPAQFLEVTALEDAEYIKRRRDPSFCASKYRIVQKYVEQPLLWNGFKADFRIYVATMSMDPPVHYLYTHQAPVRVGREPYTEERTEDTTQHITNLSKAHREDGSDVMATWDDYLLYLAEVFPGRDVELEVWSKLEEMVAAVVPLFRVKDVGKNGIGTQLAGWDVIFDGDMNPWVMEINDYPDWRTNISAISAFKYLLWAQYVDLTVNYNITNFPDRLGGFRKVNVPKKSPKARLGLA